MNAAGFILTLAVASSLPVTAAGQLTAALPAWDANSTALLWGVGGGLAKLIGQEDLSKRKALLLVGVSAVFAAAFGQLVIHMTSSYLDVPVTLLAAPVHFSLGYGAQKLLPMIPDVVATLWQAILKVAANRSNKEK